MGFWATFGALLAGLLQRIFFLPCAILCSVGCKYSYEIGFTRYLDGLNSCNFRAPLGPSGGPLQRVFFLAWAILYYGDYALAYYKGFKWCLDGLN